MDDGQITANLPLLDRINVRRAKLDSTATELKAHFVGIDQVIDKVIANVEAWYCTPELLTKPVIVCLWGLTGTGKTDLVRRLVKSLNMVDDFVEIQLTNKGSSQHVYEHSLQGLLSGSNLDPERPGVLLLDEIQRFRSLDCDGKEIHDYSFQDLWMLLSDGSFGSDSDNKQRIMEMLLDVVYNDDYNQARLAAEEEAKKKKKESKEKSKDKKEGDDEGSPEAEAQPEDVNARRRFKQTCWSARQLKRRLRLPESVEQIMCWDSNKKMDVITERMNDKSVYRPEVFSKLLVFVSGNIDEAYKMADQTEEADVDADVYHKHSQRINMLSIKSALNGRFKPEQIARFGNTHVIYPAPSRASYAEIIRRRVGVVVSGIEGLSGVKMDIDQSMYDALYRNGVFPAQGTRPVFSTITSMFENTMPSVIMRALVKGVNGVRVGYLEKSIIAAIGDELFSILNEGDIDKIKREKKDDRLIHKVAVHEAGHAVAYSVLFGLIPTQVSVLPASEDRNGFVGIHNIDGNRTSLLDHITVYMAGRAAELVVFGDRQISGGAVKDIELATSIAANYARSLGMGRNKSKVVTNTSSAANFYNLDVGPSNRDIEAVVAAQLDEAKRVIEVRLPLLRELTDHLLRHEKIGAEDYESIFYRHGVVVREMDAKETYYPDYDRMYGEFCSAQKMHCGEPATR